MIVTEEVIIIEEQGEVMIEIQNQGQMTYLNNLMILKSPIMIVTEEAIVIEEEGEFMIEIQNQGQMT